MTKIILTCILCFGICGCRTISSRYELIDGILTEVERLEIRGVGKNKADFTKDKANIENDSGIKIPEFPKLELDLNN